jgi:hypothetical protein
MCRSDNSIRLFVELAVEAEEGENEDVVGEP